ncbi:MAG: hypothetical protein OHK0023_26270 [Anaerolineae bacterium]
MLIGIDLGTSFIKGAVLDAESLSIRHVRRRVFPEPIPNLPPLRREYDAEAIVKLVRNLIDELLPLAAPCEGVVMCTQMHGNVFVDVQGRAQSPLITWQDQRVLEAHPAGGTFFEAMLANLSKTELDEFGNELRPGLPIGLWYWLAERGELPALYPAALGDYVIAALCGVPPVTELTNAASHGALNLTRLDWNREVIHRLGLGRLQLPEIVPYGTVAGRLTIGSQSLPFFTPIGDFQCAILGALLSPTELSLNISTGSQVSLLRPAMEFGNFQTRPFFDKQFLITVTTLPAGRSLNALIGLLSELGRSGANQADAWEYIIRATEAATEPDLQINLAFYATSLGDHGAITHIREDELTVGHLFRAAFRSMADNYFIAANRLSATPDWERIVFSGGLAQKLALLRHYISQRFACSFRLSPSSEDTLLGLLALGLLFTGRSGSAGEAMALLHQRYQERQP